MRIALTGVPGTGKTAIADALRKKGFEVISLNEIVEEKGLWKEVDEFGSKVVSRTKPEVLEKRLRGRGYPERKLNGNMLCELLDYCSVRSLENYKKVYEVETSGSMRKSVGEIMKITRGRGERLRA